MEDNDGLKRLFGKMLLAIIISIIATIIACVISWFIGKPIKVEETVIFFIMIYLGLLIILTAPFGHEYKKPIS